MVACGLVVGKFDMNNKKRGFLLIDGAKNTVMISYDECRDLFNLVENRGITKLIKQHKTRTELNKDITNYLNMEYIQL